MRPAGIPGTTTVPCRPSNPSGTTGLAHRREAPVGQSGPAPAVQAPAAPAPPITTRTSGWDEKPPGGLAHNVGAPAGESGPPAVQSPAAAVPNVPVVSFLSARLAPPTSMPSAQSGQEADGGLGNGHSGAAPGLGPCSMNEEWNPTGPTAQAPEPASSGRPPPPPPPPPPPAPARILSEEQQEWEISALIDNAAIEAAEQAAKQAAVQREAKSQQEQLGTGSPVRTIRIEQQYIGFVIGQGGEQLRRIREECGVSNIQIDQATKDRGFSVAQIFGPQDCVDRAVHLIEAKLAEIDPRRTPSGGFEQLRLEQSVVGFLLGRGGETLKAIKQRSGASIAIDQSTKDQGFSTMRIMGDEQAQALARELVHAKIGEARGPQSGVFEFQVEQSFVGWLIGRGGETVKQIKEQTGAVVVIDQATKDYGYSVVKIMPGPGAERARELIETKLTQVEGYGATAHEIPVDQAAVGLLIGRGGETVRQIKEQSGATMTINQVTKEAGYSMIRLGGSAEAVARAAKIIARKLEELNVSLSMGASQLHQAMDPSGRAGGQQRDSRPSDFRGAPQPQFNAVPPPQFGAVPPPNFGAVPPPMEPSEGQTSAAGQPGGDSYIQFAVKGPAAVESSEAYDPFA